MKNPQTSENLVRFLLFNDTWFQEGHLVSCMNIIFQNLQITRSDIRPHIKWAVSLVVCIWSLWKITSNVIHSCRVDW